MKFDQLNQKYYEDNIEAENKKINERKRRFLISLIGPVLMFISLIFLKEIKELSITLFIGAFISLLFFIYSVEIIVYKLKINSIKNLLKDPPYVEVFEDGKIIIGNHNGGGRKSLNKITDFHIDNIHKRIQVVDATTDFPKWLDIDFELEMKGKLLLILQMFEQMENTRRQHYINTFKETLKKYQNDTTRLLEELDTMDFILPVQCYFETSPPLFHYFDLSIDVKLGFEIREYDNKKYIALYSSLMELPQNSEFQKQYRMSYYNISKWINNQELSSGLFKEEDIIQGIVINPDYECVVVSLR